MAIIYYDIVMVFWYNGQTYTDYVKLKVKWQRIYIRRLGPAYENITCYIMKLKFENRYTLVFSLPSVYLSGLWYIIKKRVYGITYAYMCIDAEKSTQ